MDKGRDERRNAAVREQRWAIHRPNRMDAAGLPRDARFDRAMVMPPPASAFCGIRDGRSLEPDPSLLSRTSPQRRLGSPGDRTQQEPVETPAFAGVTVPGRWIRL